MTKAETSKTKLITRIASGTTDQLIEVAVALTSRFDHEANLVEVYVMRELEKRMPEDEFVMLCDKLEAMMDEAMAKAE